MTAFYTLLFFLLFAVQNSFAGHLPDRLNFEILPVTTGSTHLRGLGFGFSLEKINELTETITAIQSELSFPFLQGSRDNPAAFDWNGSFTLLAETKKCVFIGGKVGTVVNASGGQLALMAISLRVIPFDRSPKLFKWMTKQLDLGTFSNGNLYGVIRFGFSIF